jgi:hypothetical protein
MGVSMPPARLHPAVPAALWMAGSGAGHEKFVRIGGERSSLTAMKDYRLMI